MRGKSLLNEKAIIIISLNQSECRKLLRSASSRIGFSRDTGLRSHISSRQVCFYTTSLNDQTSGTENIEEGWEYKVGRLLCSNQA